MADEVLDMRKLREVVKDPGHAHKPLVGPEIKINLQYTSPEGAEYSGCLIARVPSSVDDRARIGRVQAKLAGSTPFDQMPEDWRTWATAFAKCTIQVVGDIPEWFNKWVAVDDALLYTVVNLLYVHENTFFRASAASGEESPQQRVVAVAPELVAAGVLAA